MSATIDAINRRGLLLVGCGRMGSALLRGWLDAGMDPRAVTVVDPVPSETLRTLSREGVAVNPAALRRPLVAVLAVKPGAIAGAAPPLAAFAGGETLFVSVAAGIALATLERLVGVGAPIARAMPNTPAAIGRGISAIVGNASATDADLDLAERLLAAVGKTVRLANEEQMDAVTAISGSGPAYVFHLIETLASAGEAEGLAPDMALALARATVVGAGALAESAGLHPSRLRADVTSPGGTTAAALEVLMDGRTGFAPLVREAVARAARRSRELGREA